MADGTRIEWCDCTFNPWWGCTEVGPACDHCYARTWARRLGMDLWGHGKPRRTFGDKHWNEPLSWARTLSAKLGRRPRVFCASMADVFDKDAPIGARERLWELIEGTPELDWLLLTKRIGNAMKMMPAPWVANGLPLNVWLGATVVNQEEADRDIPKLLATPARVRFLSMEPLLGPVDLTRVCLVPRQSRVDWVIVGGESGGGARYMAPTWARLLRDQCQAAGVAFFMKQMTRKEPIPADLLVREFPKAA